MKTMLAKMEREVNRVKGKHANGCISWEALAQQIAGGEKVTQTICGRSLAKWVPIPMDFATWRRKLFPSVQQKDPKRFERGGLLHSTSSGQVRRWWQRRCSSSIPTLMRNGSTLW